MNLSCIIKEAAEKNPAGIAVKENERELTYRELWESVKRLEQGLRKSGVKEGHKAAVILPASPDFIIIFFALIAVGAIVVPLEPVLTLREYREIFQDCSPEVLITSSHIILKVLGYDEFLIRERQVIISDSDPWIKRKYPGSCCFAELSSEAGSGVIKEDSGSPAALNYTFRGWGYPVGAVITQDGYRHTADVMASLADSSKNFLSLLPFSDPLSLAAGVLAPFTLGGTSYLTRNHSSAEIFRYISSERIDFLYSYPEMYTRLYRDYENGEDITCLKYPISFGNLPPGFSSKETKRVLGIEILPAYGLSEGSFVACSRPDRVRSGAVGSAAPEVKLRIIIPGSGLEAGVNVKGRIYIQSPGLMKGFYNRNKDTDRVLREDWLDTGDTGKLDRDGFLFYCAPGERTTTSNGRKIDLAEIERVLISHPCIRDVRVFAEGEVGASGKLKADVKLGKDLTCDEIKSFAVERLASYKVPDIINIS